jgi:2-haloacid dehalogenase
MVAAHAWDVTGARHAGLRGVWIARDGIAYPEVGIEPEIRAATLLEASEALASKS